MPDSPQKPPRPKKEAVSVLLSIFGAIAPHSRAQQLATEAVVRPAGKLDYAVLA